MPDLVKCHDMKSSNLIWFRGIRKNMSTSTAQKIEEVRGSSHCPMVGSINSLTLERRVWPPDDKCLVWARRDQLIRPNVTFSPSPILQIHPLLKVWIPEQILCEVKDEPALGPSSRTSLFG